MPDEKPPDIFADGVNIMVGPYGCVLTLFRVDPMNQPQPGQQPGEIVGRVRLAPALAKELARLLSENFRNLEESMKAQETVKDD